MDLKDGVKDGLIFAGAKTVFDIARDAQEQAENEQEAKFARLGFPPFLSMFFGWLAAHPFWMVVFILWVFWVLWDSLKFCWHLAVYGVLLVGGHHMIPLDAEKQAVDQFVTTAPEIVKLEAWRDKNTALSATVRNPTPWAVQYVRYLCTIKYAMEDNAQEVQFNIEQGVAPSRPIVVQPGETRRVSATADGGGGEIENYACHLQDVSLVHKKWWVPLG